jgi:phosphoglycolate phosphatase-like HAD superfamily hydrolase
MSRIIVFDVNETLLDLTALDGHFERIFRVAGVREEWFKQVVQSALLTTILDAYSDFAAVGAAALEMTAAVHDVPLTRDDRNAILGAMRELPPHPEVPDSLRRLHEAGLRLCALTNSTQTVADAQLEHAGLARYSSASCRPIRCAGSSPMRPSTTWRHANAVSNRLRCGSWPSIRGMSPERCAPAGRRPLSPARGWCPIPFLGSQTSWVPTSLW